MSGWTPIVTMFVDGEPGDSEIWRVKVAREAAKHLGAEPLSGPLRIDRTYFFKRPKEHFGLRKGKYLERGVDPGKTLVVDHERPFYPKKPYICELDQVFFETISRNHREGRKRLGIQLISESGLICDGNSRKLYATGTACGGLRATIYIWGE